MRGFVNCAVHDKTWAQLRFDCGDDRYWVVFVSTASGDERPGTARRLATLAEKRLR